LSSRCYIASCMRRPCRQPRAIPGATMLHKLSGCTSITAFRLSARISQLAGTGRSRKNRSSVSAGFLASGNGNYMCRYRTCRGIVYGRRSMSVGTHLMRGVKRILRVYASMWNLAFACRKHQSRNGILWHVWLIPVSSPDPPPSNAYKPYVMLSIMPI